MDEPRCPFNQTLRSEIFGCEHAVAVTRRDGPDVSCASQRGQARCTAVFQGMKGSALAALGVEDDPQQVAHSVVVKVQFGGLLGLQRRLGAAPPEPERIENIDALMERAVEHFGSVADIPYTDLSADISAHQVKRRRNR